MSYIRVQWGGNAFSVHSLSCILLSESSGSSITLAWVVTGNVPGLPLDVSDLYHPLNLSLRKANA